MLAPDVRDGKEQNRAKPSALHALHTMQAIGRPAAAGVERGRWGAVSDGAFQLVDDSLVAILARFLDDDEEVPNRSTIVAVA